MTFSEKLFKLRTQEGYSQEDLAEKLQVSRQAVSKWEMGNTLPETDKIIAIGRIFDVSIDYLLNDDFKLDANRNLDRLVLKFLGYAQDMDQLSKELISIVKDGVIDNKEKIRMDEIINTLEVIAAIIGEIKEQISA